MKSATEVFAKYAPRQEPKQDKPKAYYEKCLCGAEVPEYDIYYSSWGQVCPHCGEHCSVCGELVPEQFTSKLGKHTICDTCMDDFIRLLASRKHKDDQYFWGIDEEGTFETQGVE